MPRITRVYTRAGDDGTTGLCGGQRVPKDSVRYENLQRGIPDVLGGSRLKLARVLNPILA